MKVAAARCRASEDVGDNSSCVARAALSLRRPCSSHLDSLSSNPQICANEIRYNVRIIYGTSDAAIDIDELNLNRYNEEFEVDRRVRRLHSDGHTAKHYYQ